MEVNGIWQRVMVVDSRQRKAIGATRQCKMIGELEMWLCLLDVVCGEIS